MPKAPAKASAAPAAAVSSKAPAKKVTAKKAPAKKLAAAVAAAPAAPAAVAATMKAAPIDTVMGPLTWAPNGDLKGFEFGVFQWHADGTSTQLK